jgi:putative ABC transport system permease protein
MRLLAIRTLAAHRARLAMTLAAVCLGAAFVAGSLLVTASVEVGSAMRNAMLGFAGIALLVGSFVIANTFAMLVGQRTRELALLRAIGLSRRQLRRLVLGEALVVGLVGGVAGTALGGGFAAAAVRAIRRRSGSRRPATAARILPTISSTPITALPLMCPHLLGITWSSRWIPATPACS